jgi:hypothetical protein
VKGRDPIRHPGIWIGNQLESNPSWIVRLDAKDVDELEKAARKTFHLPLDKVSKGNFPLPFLGKRLTGIQDSLENGSGASLVKGFPAETFGEELAKRAFWGICHHIGIPISQSALGEKIFSVRNEGYQDGDNRQRGPNTNRKLSFHSDRSDVIGFLCWKQAKAGGENQMVHSMALHNEILEKRPDLLEELYKPFYYKRHNVDSGNDLPYCSQPIFSVTKGFFACNILRVLIDRAYELPELPDMTGSQREALDFLEETASCPLLHYSFRQEPGDMLFMNNFTVLHRRSAFADHPEPGLRRHNFRVWLSVPNSRPLDPLFEDNYGAVEAGALRGGMKPALATNKE